METGNGAAMDSLHTPFNRRITSFFHNLWSLTGDSGATVFNALSLNIADLATMLLSLSFAYALQLATVSLQIQSKPPPSLHMLSLSILLGFSTLLVAKFADVKLLQCLGFLFLVAAFFIAISIPYPLYFWIISFTVFLATVALIIYFTIIHVPKTPSPPLSISEEPE